jgi:hypothetical protein
LSAAEGAAGTGPVALAAAIIIAASTTESAAGTGFIALVSTAIAAAPVGGSASLALIAAAAGTG